MQYVADAFEFKTIHLILQFHILEKILLSSYNNISDSDYVNYNNNTINNLVNNYLFNFV